VELNTGKQNRSNHGTFRVKLRKSHVGALNWKPASFQPCNEPLRSEPRDPFGRELFEISKKRQPFVPGGSTLAGRGNGTPRHPGSGTDPPTAGAAAV